MNASGVLSLLGAAPFGVYAVSLDQTIVFWNGGAQRLLGFSSEEVVGRRCYEVMAGLSPGDLTPACLLGCPTVRALRAGVIPFALPMRMLCASGERKTFSLVPMVLADAENDAPLIVHLFADVSEGGDAPQLVRDELSQRGAGTASDHVPAARHPADYRRLTRRELEVLRMVALGRATEQIAVELGLSQHTVRNHVRNLRHKLDAKTKLDAVLTAMRLGFLDGP